MIVAVDFGTTRTKVAYLDQAGNPTIIPNARGDETTPTVVHYQADGNHLIGRDAEEQGYLEPELCLKGFKLQLGKNENIAKKGTGITPAKAAEIFIGKIKEQIIRHLNMDVSEVLPTCPANFRDDAKKALMDAFEANGLKVLKLLPEPTAAGINYGNDKVNSSAFLVYDFGGGTFDVSVLRKTGKKTDILATEGISKLGGNDINNLIMDRIVNKIESEMGSRPDPQTDALFYHDLMDRVENAKKSLGNRKEVPIVISYNGTQIIDKLTQEWFHNSIDPLIDQTLESVNKAVEGAGLEMSDINSLVLVGGTSRIPHVQHRVSQHTGLNVKTDIDPEKAIVFGAAIASIVELHQQGRTATIGGKVIPAPEIQIQDITAHSVGCCVVDGKGANRRLFNSMIIAKNTQIPCQHNDRFMLEYDDQTCVKIEILQGDNNADRQDCLLIGELSLENLPLEKVRTPRIEVDYAIDGNGMVKATATDIISGITKTVSVDYKSGIQSSTKTI